MNFNRSKGIFSEYIILKNSMQLALYFSTFYFVFGRKTTKRYLFFIKSQKDALLLENEKYQRKVLLQKS